MKALIESILGVYTPLTDADGVIITTVAGLDWSWIIGALCFVLCLWSVFRLVGVLLRG